jgi:hypothetical protein
MSTAATHNYGAMASASRADGGNWHQPTPSADGGTYADGDYISTPWGQLVYQRLGGGEGAVVKTRALVYQVPGHLKTRDEIRGWVIRCIQRGFIRAGSGTLYQPSMYLPGEGISTSKGTLVFKGVGSDGYLHVQTRTEDLRVPTELKTRDEVRAWVVRQVDSGRIRSPLYPGSAIEPAERLARNEKAPADFTDFALPDRARSRHQRIVATTTGGAAPHSVSGDVYSNFGLQRPLSNLSSLGAMGLAPLLRKVPNGGRLVQWLSANIPAATVAGRSDGIRLEAGTSLVDRSNFAHVKLGLEWVRDYARGKTAAQMARELESVLGRLSSPQRRAELQATMAAVKLLIDRYESSKLSASVFKALDLRFTIDPSRPQDGFRLGLHYSPRLADTGSLELYSAISARLRFDKQGNRIGYQLMAFLEANSKTTRSGAWAGLGTVAQYVATDGDSASSPWRQDAQGRIGLEYKLQGKVCFVELPPSAREFLEVMGISTTRDLPVSRAPSVTALQLAHDVLKTEDLQVVAELERAAALVDKAEGTASRFSDIVSGLSQIGTLASIGGGLSAPAAGVAALAAGGAVLLNQEPVADATLNGAQAKLRRADIEDSAAKLLSIDRFLSVSRAWSGQERAEAERLLSQLQQMAEKWCDAGKPVPQDCAALWSPDTLETLRRRVEGHL